MELYIVRHAEAVPRGPKYTEAKRPLTPTGQREFQSAVTGLKRLGVRFDHLYFSPWLRASQTADLLMPLLKGESEATLHLTRSPKPALLKLLVGQRIAVVGHQPWLGELLTLLILNNDAAGSQFELEKGGVAVLRGTLRPGRMTLTAVWTPSLLARIRKSKP